MSDIYKSREPLPGVKKESNPKKGRRRSSSRRAFDDTGNRRRRKKNSGFRRLLHLARKNKNEKKFWWGLLISVVVGLMLLAIWQFLYLEHVARQQARQNELYVPLMPGESAPDESMPGK
jgi:transposase